MKIGLYPEYDRKKTMSATSKAITFFAVIAWASSNLAKGGELDGSAILQQCKTLSAFDLPMDPNGKLTEEFQEKFRYDLYWNPEASDQERVRGLVALWFNGTNFDSIALAWWASKKDQSLLRILSMAVNNLRWEPTSLILPYGLWADRFEKSERDIRFKECLFLDVHSAEIASYLLDVLERELEMNPNDNMKRIQSELKAIVKHGGMPK